MDEFVDSTFGEYRGPTTPDKMWVGRQLVRKNDTLFIHRHEDEILVGVDSGWDAYGSVILTLDQARSLAYEINQLLEENDGND